MQHLGAPERLGRSTASGGTVALADEAPLHSRHAVGAQERLLRVGLEHVQQVLQVQKTCVSDILTKLMRKQLWYVI